MFYKILYLVKTFFLFFAIPTIESVFVIQYSEKVTGRFITRNSGYQAKKTRAHK